MGAGGAQSLLRRETQDTQLETTLLGEEEPVGRTVHPVGLAHPT